LRTGGAAGRPLTPVAVEEGPGEILVVRGPGTMETLRKVAENVGFSPIASTWDRTIIPWEKSALPLGEQDRVRVVDPDATWFSGEGTASAVFGVSQELGGKQGGLFWWLTHTGSATPQGPTHLADAVAVAGVKALADQRRRAVLLVLSGEPADASRWDPAAVRSYLAAIRVPLYVWSLRPPPYPPGVAAWGKVEDVSIFFQMNRAYGQLTQDLAAQRIVWVNGRHLPQSIALSPPAANAAKAAKGIELVAGPER